MLLSRLGSMLIHAARTFQVLALLVFGGQQAIVHAHHHLHTRRCHSQDVQEVSRSQTSADCGLCTLDSPVEFSVGGQWTPSSYPPQPFLGFQAASPAHVFRVTLPPARGPPTAV